MEETKNSGEALPQPEPFQFHLTTNKENVDKELQPVVSGIQEVQGSMVSLTNNILFHWKEFPINPPKLISAKRFSGNAEKSIFKNLFVAPTFDELEEVANDPNTNQAKNLSKVQLQQIKNNGQFDVPSIHFEGEHHTWRLSALLQKGNMRAMSSLFGDTALSLKLIIIVALDRFTSHFFSLAQAGRAVFKCIWQFCDLIIGLPRLSLNKSSLTAKLQNEHSKFLVAELCNAEPEKWKIFCDYVKSKVEEQKKKDFRKFHDDKKSTKAPPYLFKTPNGIPIDLRLFNAELMGKCNTILQSILKQEATGWYIKYRQTLLTELKGKDLSSEEIDEKINVAVQEEYMKRVVKAIYADDRITSLQPKLGEALVEQATCARVMRNSIEELQKKMERLQAELVEQLETNYPIRSRIKTWKRRQIAEFQRQFIEQHRIAAHESAIEACKHWQLGQSVYFLTRDMLFVRDRETALRSEFEKIREVDRTYSFSVRKWFPSNWVISRRDDTFSHNSGMDEVIPTVISNMPAIYTGFQPSSQTLKGTNYIYSVRKYTTFSNTCRYPFWRWINYFYRTYSWTWGSMYYFMITIPWNSRVSFRALFFKKTFMYGLTINNKNGQLCPDRSTTVSTLLSRLRSLWHHVFKSRSKFEASSDTGFLDKSVTRHLNRFWNYILKGACGSALLVITMIPLCLLTSTGSLVMGITAPVWMPIVTLGFHLFSSVIYDFDHPRGSNAILYLFDTLIYRLVIQGLLQPVLALLVAVLCPIGSVFVLIWAAIRYGNRSLWDAFMLNVLIARRGRIPASDSFVSRRIAGPGLASDYFYQIQPAQALAAVESRMQLDELQSWKTQTQLSIEQPKQLYRKLVSECFKPFSGGLFENEGVFADLSKETQSYLNQLNDSVNERRRLLNTGLKDDGDIASRVKVTSAELKVIVGHASRMIEQFYPQHVFARSSKPEQDFWDSRGLVQLDWNGLACQLLGEIFSPEFMVPLEETNKSVFHLEVEHLNLSRYIDMLKDSKFRDDLDLVNPIHRPKGKIGTNMPFISISIFNPILDDLSATGLFTVRPHSSWMKPWKLPKNNWATDVSRNLTLMIPLPISHPAAISLIIYNRENEANAFQASDFTRIENVLRSSRALTYDPLTSDLENSSINSGSQESLVPGVSCQTTVPVTSSECYAIGSTGDEDDHLEDEEELQQNIAEDDPMAIAYV